MNRIPAQEAAINLPSTILGRPFCSTRHFTENKEKTQTGFDCGKVIFREVGGYELNSNAPRCGRRRAHLRLQPLLANAKK